MNYELLIARNMPWIFYLILLVSVVFISVRNVRRNGKSLSFGGVTILFLAGVAVIWMASEAFHKYASWRVSVYDENGDQFFANTGRLDDRLYSHLMDVVVNDSGQALQPLGAIIVSAGLVILAWGLTFAVTQYRVGADKK